MKKTFLLISYCLLALGGYSKNLSAYFYYSTFNTPKNEPYLETYLNIHSSSIHYLKNESGKFQARIQVKINLEQDDKLIFSDAYVVKSQEIESLEKSTFDIIDLQRISVKNGAYKISITLLDLGDTAKINHQLEELVNINFNDSINFSSIELLENFEISKEENKFTKNGYLLVPYVNNFFPENLKTLKYYSEIYHLDKDDVMQDYLLYSFVERYENSEKIPGLISFKKIKSRPVHVVLQEFPIENLESGNYNLVLELRDKTNTILSTKKIFFQRKNLEADGKSKKFENLSIKNTFADTIQEKNINEFLRCLYPISSQDEDKYEKDLVNELDLERKKQFFYYFWQKRNSIEPASAWEEYSKQVEIVNRTYNTAGKKGYRTDRGRVYLKYGPPSNINSNKLDHLVLPYEIWHYTQVRGLTRKRFVFFNEEQFSDDYRLLHSDVYGENYEPGWSNIIMTRFIGIESGSDGNRAKSLERLQNDYRN